jgi:two-component SAPR family response regulator
MQSLQAALPDLVILDIKLAQDNGLDCLRRIKEFNASIPVILNSGYSTYKDDFSSWLADAYLVKTSNTQELTNKVRELLDMKPVV